LHLGTQVVDATHASTSADSEVTNQYIIAEEPLPHINNAGNFPPANSVGFGIPLGKAYFHRTQWAREVVLLPLGATTNSSFDGTQWTASTGSLYTAAVNATNTFLAEDSHNKLAMIVISLGLLDSTAGANATFEASLDALINKFRSDAFTGNTLQSVFTKVPVVVCGLPTDFISTTGAAATAIDAILVDTPNRLSNTAFADPDVGYATETSDNHWDATAQRLFGEVIYTAYLNTFKNITL